MAELTLQLPETLQQRLETLAENEGVPLHSFILYTLTRQASLAYTIEVKDAKAVAEQQANFADYLQKLGKGSDAEIAAILAKREVVEPESDLLPETIARLRQLISNQKDSAA